MIESIIETIKNMIPDWIYQIGIGPCILIIISINIVTLIIELILLAKFYDK